MIRRSLAVLGLVTLAAMPAAAQVPGLDIRVGAHAVVPSADMADGFDTGFGAYGRIGMPMGPLKLMGSVTWNRFAAKAGSGLDDQDVITLQAGPHFGLALLDLGIEAAYYTEIEKMGLSPNISIALMKFDLTASYNTTFEDPKATWMTVGVGFRF